MKKRILQGENHTPCLFRNKDWGHREKIKCRSFLYDFFFYFYETKVLDRKTGKPTGNIYYERINKLDNLFDWICSIFNKNYEKKNIAR